MQTNVLRAIINLVNTDVTNLSHRYSSTNRANQMGEGLESYVKDLFAGTIYEVNEQKRIENYGNTFSYLGNQNNPPDIIIRGGDAIEVKKIEISKNSSFSSTLALNSSYPKDKLYSNSSMITEECRSCEVWTEKDILYIIGIVEKTTLRELFFIYGIDYAAKKAVYERIKETISKGIREIPDVEFAKTNELARINKIDPLGITDLRVRGMWQIVNPINVFKYVHNRTVNSNFTMQCIINEEKIESFTTELVELRNLTKQKNQLKINNIVIKDPNNPAKLKKAYHIVYDIGISQDERGRR
jgi:hypothetical protein